MTRKYRLVFIFVFYFTVVLAVLCIKAFKRMGGINIFNNFETDFLKAKFELSS